MKTDHGVRALVRLRIVATSVWASMAALLRACLPVRRGSSAQLAPGDPAPGFNLPASDGRVYRLSDLTRRGTVVMAWFPKAFTAGCAAECTSLQASCDEAAAAGALYVGVNVDTPETNRQFARALGLTFPILSDRHGAVARAYGVLGRTGLPARRTFIIGADGRIAAIDRHVRVSSHGADVLTRLGRRGTPAERTSLAERS